MAMARRIGITTPQVTGMVTLFESAGFSHCALELFELQSLDEPVELRLKIDVRPSIDFLDNCSNEIRWGRATGLGSLLWRWKA